MRLKEKQRLSKTEKLLVINYVMAVGLSMVTIALGLLGREMYYMQMLSGEWIAQTAVFSGLYCWKEKAANKQKYAQQWIEEISEKMDPNQAAQFLEIITRD